MSNYADLIKRLRSTLDKEVWYAPVMAQAADAIEALVKERDTALRDGERLKQSHDALLKAAVICRDAYWYQYNGKRLVSEDTRNHARYLKESIRNAEELE